MKKILLLDVEMRNPIEISTLKVVELKDELKKRHLSCAGKEEVLVQRLQDELEMEEMLEMEELLEDSSEVAEGAPDVVDKVSVKRYG